MSEKEKEDSIETADEQIQATEVEPETGRPRSSSYTGGMRSPLDDKGGVGILEPQIDRENDRRTGKKLSQWGASSRRRSFWRSLYYQNAAPSGTQEIDE